MRDRGHRVILKALLHHADDGRLVLATVASRGGPRKGTMINSRHPAPDLGVKKIIDFYFDEPSRWSTAEKVKLLDGVHAVFFSGGDQLRITSQIAATNVCTRYSLAP